MVRFIRNWLWLPVFLALIAACVVGVKMFDLEEILRKATIICLPCIGIG